MLFGEALAERRHRRRREVQDVGNPPRRATACTFRSVCVVVLRTSPTSCTSRRRRCRRSARGSPSSTTSSARGCWPRMPAERFQSAEEVLGALRVLAPDSSRTHPTPWPAVAPPVTRRRRVVIAAALGVLAAVLAGWYWTRPPRLPPPPEDARRWYLRGTEAIREGAYRHRPRGARGGHSEVPAVPRRLCKAGRGRAELDDQGSAQKRLLRLSALVPDETRLPSDEQLRVRAVRSLVLRDVDAAVNASADVVTRHPGRSRRLGGPRARAGVRRPPQRRRRVLHARHRRGSTVLIAHLRLGPVEGSAWRMDASLAAFNEAERLYRLTSSSEGETEVLLRRGIARDAAGDLKAARADTSRKRWHRPRRRNRRAAGACAPRTGERDRVGRPPRRRRTDGVQRGARGHRGRSRHGGRR